MSSRIPHLQCKNKKLPDTDLEINQTLLNEVERSNAILEKILAANLRVETLTDVAEREDAFAAIFASLQADLVDVKPNSMLLADINITFASTIANKWKLNYTYGIRNCDEKQYILDKADWQERMNKAKLIYSEQKNSICESKLVKLEKSLIETQQLWSKLDAKFQKKDFFHLAQSFFANELQQRSENFVSSGCSPVNHRKRKML